MKLVYVTACMPYGPGETFIISEIAELMRKHEVLVVPRSPGALGDHASWLASHTAREQLLSLRVLARAFAVCLSRPRELLSILRIFSTGRHLRTLLANLAVLPKGLWLAHTAKRWGADHIHCHWAGTTATMAMIASRASGIPWSLTTHRSDIVSNNLLPQKARSAVFVRAIAGEGRRMLLERGVESESKLLVVPMGVRIPVSGPTRHHVNAVLCPADLLPVKGHRFLLAAWKMLMDRGVTGELLLAGSGELEAELRSTVARFGLNTTVSFLGTLKHETLLDLYRRGEVTAVVLASIDLGGGVHEGVPVALVEAMSHGVPVVATATGGIPELIQPGTGLLVPPENPEALANALQRLLNDSEFAQAVATVGQRWVAQTRDISRVAARLEDLFEEARNPGHAVQHNRDDMPQAGRISLETSRYIS